MRKNHQRWVLLAYVAGAAMVGLTVQAAAVSGFAQFAVPDSRLGPLTVSSLLAIAGAGLTFLALVRNEKGLAFSLEVVGELAKVTWPTKEETLRASTTVVVTTLFVAAVLGAYDFLWKNLADIVLLRADLGVS